MLDPDLLCGVDIFQGLDDAQLAHLSDIMLTEDYDAGGIICKQGDPADMLYIIVRGQAEVQVQGESGTQAVVYLGRGQIIGEMTLVDAGTRSATVVAVDDDTQVACLPHAAFNELCEAQPLIGYRVIRNIAQDLSFKLRHRDTTNTAHLNATEEKT